MGNGHRAGGWTRWGGIFLGGHFGTLCSCMWLVQGMSGDLRCPSSTSSVSAVGREKKVGLRAKVLDITVVALLEWRDSVWS